MKGGVCYGRESGIALESDYDVDYGYDAYGRLQSVESAQSADTFTYTYLGGTDLVSGMTASTGHAWTRSYEPHRNLITAVTNSFNGNLISAFDYVNDSIGRRTARLDSQPAGVAITNAFGYNVRSEVTSANMGTNTYGYVFDPIGNRIISTNNADVTSYAANELNQYTNILCASEPLREPSHDEDGNMLTNGVWSYSWDGENRLRSVSSNNVLLATHTYDHQSRRVGKFSHEDAKTRSYVYDGWNLIQELTHTQTHTLTNLYTWGLDLSGTLQGAGGVGGLLAVISPLPLGDGQGEGGTVYLPCYDANGNVTEYSSTDGTLAAHYEYSPFGETVIQSGELADSFSFRFSTKCWEDETKLYYYGYRFYEPNIGRWLNRDPIEEHGGVNIISSCNNSLIRRVDPDGRRWAWPFSAGAIVCKTIKEDQANLLSMEEQQQLAVMREKKCKIPEIKCECCDKPGEKGYFDPTTKDITICTNSDSDTYYKFRWTRKHEMSHAFDDCMGLDWDCDKRYPRLCSELRAYATVEGSADRSKIIEKACASFDAACTSNIHGLTQGTTEAVRFDLCRIDAEEIYDKCTGLGPTDPLPDLPVLPIRR